MFYNYVHDFVFSDMKKYHIVTMRDIIVYREDVYQYCFGPNPIYPSIASYAIAIIVTILNTLQMILTIC